VASPSYAQSEELTPANEPITDDIKTDASDPTIELDNLYDGLKSGRWLVVSGERTDIANTNGVKTSELVMLESVTQGVRILQRVPPSNTTSTESDIDWPGDTTHTFLHLATPLAYTYKRDTVTVGANVVKATHGQTRNEVLGSWRWQQVFTAVHPQAVALNLCFGGYRLWRGKHATGACQRSPLARDG